MKITVATLDDQWFVAEDGEYTLDTDANLLIVDGPNSSAYFPWSSVSNFITVGEE